jgi:hypothetical protein
MAQKTIIALPVDNSRMSVWTTGGGTVVHCEIEIQDNGGGVTRVTVDPVAVLGAGNATTLRTLLGQLYTAAVAAGGFA